MPSNPISTSTAPLKLLVLGGTVFLGRHVVTAALAAGHDVTVFNRGRRAPDFHRPVSALIGDRDADTSALRGHRFDAVIDCSGYRPAQISRVAEALETPWPHWVFVSTISVLERFAPRHAYDESAPVTAASTGYGGEKARAEETLQALTGGQCTIVRPGLIVGRHDPTGRFSYWPWRVAQGGAVLAPGRPERLVQVIDAQDLAAWCVQLATTRTPGTFHAVGPTQSMQSVLETCREASGVKAHFVWRTDAELLAAGVTPWTGLPLWLPEEDADFGGMLLGRRDKAEQAGLRSRPLIDTVRDILSEQRDDPARATFAHALARDAEARLLDSALNPH